MPEQYLGPRLSPKGLVQEEPVTKRSGWGLNQASLTPELQSGTPSHSASRTRHQGSHQEREESHRLPAGPSDLKEEAGQQSQGPSQP